MSDPVQYQLLKAKLAWAERVRKLALARKTVAGDPLTRTPKQRLEYRRLTAELDRVLWEVK